jgi:hypothetical protein
MHPILVGLLGQQAETTEGEVGGRIASSDSSGAHAVEHC